jgi:hypothetical protein
MHPFPTTTTTTTTTITTQVFEVVKPSGSPERIKRKEAQYPKQVGPCVAALAMTSVLRPARW